jgi:protein-disulfide isomerase
VERTERPLRERQRVTRRPSPRPAWRSPFVLVSAGALVVAAAIILLNQKPAPAPGSDFIQPPINWSSAVTDGQTAGSANAPVTLEVYADYQCPVCSRFDREELASLKASFIDTGILRIVAKDIAILGAPGARDESLELAVGARCAADQGKFWAYHDLVYWNQQRENKGDYTAEFVSAIANRAGVNLSTWKDCVDGKEARAAVQAASAAALAAGINSTPTIVLNGGAPAAGLPDLQALGASIQNLAKSAASPAPSATP